MQIVMESNSEKQRYIENPLRLLRCAVELGQFAVKGLLDKVDDALDVPWDPEDYMFPTVAPEAPVATEEELL